ncbi:hypothetical protein DFS34DRAFT_693085 [Phlyctochytrium arcticum]|nr:hypothetical protein DFS34DRAFT_693085 [Phlyctochytrium arcticum]
MGWGQRLATIWCIWSASIASAAHFQIGKSYEYQLKSETLHVTDASEGVHLAEALPIPMGGDKSGHAKTLVDVKFSVTPYGKDLQNRTLCYFEYIGTPKIRTLVPLPEGGYRDISNPATYNYNTFWSGFAVSETGLVDYVLAVPQEDASLLKLKKRIIGLFSHEIYDKENSNALHSRDFVTTEEDMSGPHHAEYTVSKRKRRSLHARGTMDNLLVFRKKLSRRSVENFEDGAETLTPTVDERGNLVQPSSRINQEQEKVVEKHEDRHEIRSVLIRDRVWAAGTVSSDLRIQKRTETQNEQPMAMHAGGSTALDLIKVSDIGDPREYPELATPGNVAEMQPIDEFSKKKLSLDEALKIVQENLGCFDGSVLNSNHTKTKGEKAQCFGNARSALLDMADAHAVTAVQRILHNYAHTPVGYVAVNMVAEVCKKHPGLATDILQHTFGARHRRDIQEDALEATLHALHDCTESGSEAIELVGDLARHASYNGSYAAETENIRNHAILTLGSMSKRAIQEGNVEAGENAASTLHQMLANIDKTKLREASKTAHAISKRDVERVFRRGENIDDIESEKDYRPALVSEEDFPITYFSNILLGLGNAAHPKSLPVIQGHLYGRSVAEAKTARRRRQNRRSNDAANHTQKHGEGHEHDDGEEEEDHGLYFPEAIQTAALHALGEFQGEHVENDLLAALAFSGSPAIKTAARESYKKARRSFSIEDVAAGAEELEDLLAQDPDRFNQVVHRRDLSEDHELVQGLSRRALRARSLLTLRWSDGKLTIAVQTPSFIWDKSWGAPVAGLKASVTILNRAGLTASLLKTGLYIDIDNQAGAYLYFALFGYTQITIFNAAARLKAALGYNLDMLKGFKLSDIYDAANRYLTLVSQIHDQLFNEFSDILEGATNMRTALSIASLDIGVNMRTSSFGLDNVIISSSPVDELELLGILAQFKDIENSIRTAATKINAIFVQPLSPIIDELVKDSTKLGTAVRAILVCPQQGGDFLLAAIEEIVSQFYKVDQITDQLRALMALDRREGLVPVLDPEYLDQLMLLARSDNSLVWLRDAVTKYRSFLSTWRQLGFQWYDKYHDYKVNMRQFEKSQTAFINFVTENLGSHFDSNFPARPFPSNDDPEKGLVFPNAVFEGRSGSWLRTALDEEIPMPMTGRVRWSQGGVATIEVQEVSLRPYYIYISGLRMKDERSGISGNLQWQRFKKGAGFAIATSSRIHVAIGSKTGAGEWIDPEKYLPEVVPKLLQRWYPDPNYYVFQVLGRFIVPMSPMIPGGAVVGTDAAEAIEDRKEDQKKKKEQKKPPKPGAKAEKNKIESKNLDQIKKMEPAYISDWKNTPIQNPDDICYVTEFDSPEEMCGGGMLAEKKTSITLWEFSTRVLVAGFIPVEFGIAFLGLLGVQVGATVCVMNLMFRPVVAPGFGVAIRGHVAIDFFIASIGLSVTGIVADTSVPFTVHFPFTTFPTGTCFDIAIIIFPLAFEIAVFATINLLFVKINHELIVARWPLAGVSYTILDVCPPKGGKSAPSGSGIVIDNTPPVFPTLSAFQLPGQNPTAPLCYAEWQADDIESGMDSVSIGVGYGPGDTSVVKRQTVKRGMGNTIAIPGPTNMDVFDERTLWMVATAKNMQGGETTVSQPFLWDLSPPVINVWEGNLTQPSNFRMIIGQNETWVTQRKNLRAFTTDISAQVNGTAAQSHTKGLTFSYDIADQSPVEEVKYAIGTGSDATTINDTVPWTALPKKSFGTIAVTGLTLLHGIKYFLALQASDKIGYTSFLQSSGTLVDLTPPYTPASQLFFGTTLRSNWGGSNQRASLYLNHYGFADNETDIAVWNYAVGPSNLQPEAIMQNPAQWTSFGGWSTYKVATPSSTGDVAVSIDGYNLAEGNHTVCVQATNFVGLKSVVCRDGYLVDYTPPTGTVSIEQGAVLGEIYLIFQYADDRAGVRSFSVGLGDGFTPRYSGYYKFDPALTNITNFTIPIDSSLAGTLIYGQLQVEDWAGNFMVASTAEPLVVNFFPPHVGVVYDGTELGDSADFVDSTDVLCASWTAWLDTITGVGRYDLSFGYMVGETDIIPWTTVDLLNSTSCLPVTNASVTQNALVFANVRGWTDAGENSKYAVASSPGTIIDITGPTPFEADITSATAKGFQNQKEFIRLAWNASSDAESGLAKYTVECFEQGGTVVLPPTVIDTSLPLKLGGQIFGVPLRTGSTFYCNVTAFNNAGSRNTYYTSTNSLIVDDTPPVLGYLTYNGASVYGSRVYVTNATYISIPWSWSDAESGLADGSLKCEFTDMDGFPVSSVSVNISDSGCLITSTTALQEDGEYIISVSAINNADLQRKLDFEINIATIPPQLLAAGVGLTSVGSPSLVKSTVNDRFLGWFQFAKALNPLSAVYVGFGPNVTHPLEFSNGSYLAIDPAQTYVTIPYLLGTGETYCMVVYGENVAGWRTLDVNAGCVEVVEGAKPGYVYDGPDLNQELQIQWYDDMVIATFANFTHYLPGSLYTWSLGTYPNGTDIVAPTSAFLFYPTKSTPGYVNFPTDLLSTGIAYFITINGTFGTSGPDSYTESVYAVSAGFRIVNNAPSEPVLKIGNSSELQYVSLQAAEQITFGCDATSETGSEGFDQLVVRAGHDPILANGLLSYDASDDLTLAHRTFKNLVDLSTAVSGMGVYADCIATDNRMTGTSAKVRAGPLVVDGTPPVAPKNFSCTPETVTPSVPFQCSWDSFTDHESGVVSIEIALGTTKGGSEIMAFQPVSQSDYTFDPVFVYLQSAASNYHVTLLARNGAGLTTSAFAILKIDNTPPRVNSNLLRFLSEIPTLVMSNGTTIVAAASQVDCQRSKSIVNIAWDGVFADRESGMSSYSVAIRQNQGTSIFLSWTDVGNITTAKLTLTKAITPGMSIIALVRGKNGAGLISQAVSTPIGVVDRGPTAMDVHQITVSTGVTGAFQNERNLFSAGWKFEHPCPIAGYKWWIQDNSTSVIVSNISTTTADVVVATDLDLQPRHAYVAFVKAFNNLGMWSEAAVSAPVTIVYSPARPAPVYDGINFYRETAEQTNRYEIGGSWDDFSTDTCLVSNYKYAVGTNFSDSETVANVVGWTDSGVVRQFQLTLSTALQFYTQYYVSVNATSCTGDIISSSSPGFSVGQREAPTAGSVALDNQNGLENATAQTSAAEVLIRWAGFVSNWSPLDVDVALTNDTEFNNSSFVVPFTRVPSSSSAYKFTNLTLNTTNDANTTYYGIVRVTDMNFQMVHASTPAFVVNITLPAPVAISFPGQSDNATQVWQAQPNFEITLGKFGEDINDVKYAVVSPPSSNSSLRRRDDIFDPVTAVGDPNSLLVPFTSIGDLNSSSVSVDVPTSDSGTSFVVIQAINQAGLNTIVASPPINFDVTPPVIGTLRQGPDPSATFIFSGVNDSVTLTWGQFVDQDTCSGTTDDFSVDPASRWGNILNGTTVDYGTINATNIFVKGCVTQITNIMTLHAVSDVTTPSLIRGCDVASNVYASGSTYSIRMKASAVIGAVSSIVLTDSESALLFEKTFILQKKWFLDAPATYNAVGAQVVMTATGPVVYSWSLIGGDNVLNGQSLNMEADATANYLVYTFTVNSREVSVEITNDENITVGGTRLSPLVVGTSNIRGTPNLALRFGLWGVSALDSQAKMIVSSVTTPSATDYPCNYGRLFGDPESGVGHYEIGVGTLPTVADIIPFTAISVRNWTQTCASNDVSCLPQAWRQNVVPSSSQFILEGKLSNVSIPAYSYMEQWCQLDPMDGGCSPLATCDNLGPLDSNLNPSNASVTYAQSLNLNFTCVCPPGYNGTGYGYDCVDIDECAIQAANGTAVCDSSAICINVPGSYQCSCPNGFQGNPLASASIVGETIGCFSKDFCSSFPCGASGRCIQLNGDYTCDCNPGYHQADSHTCLDNDECALGTHQCDPRATCVNVAGTYTCNCPAGTVGSGFGPNGCRAPGSSGSGASCAGAAPISSGAPLNSSIPSNGFNSDPRITVMTGAPRYAVWFQFRAQVQTVVVTASFASDGPTRAWLLLFSSCAGQPISISKCAKPQNCTVSASVAVGSDLSVSLLTTQPTNFTIKTENGGSPACLAPCLHGGVCVGDNVCSCPGGYVGTNCQTPVRTMLPRNSVTGAHCTGPVNVNGTVYSPCAPGDKPGIAPSSPTFGFEGCWGWGSLSSPVNTQLQIAPNNREPIISLVLASVPRSLIQKNTNADQCASSCRSQTLPYFLFFNSTSTQESACICMSTVMSGSIPSPISACSSKDKTTKVPSYGLDFLGAAMFHVELESPWCNIPTNAGSFNLTGSTEYCSARKTWNNSVCIFPFNHKGTVFTDCIASDSNTGIPWCYIDKALSVKQNCLQINWCTGSAVENIANGQCISSTNSTMESWTVDCDPGFRYNAQNQTCVDIDECAEMTDECDYASTSCVNTFGSYQCQCLNGFTPTPVSTICQPVPIVYPATATPGSVQSPRDTAPRAYYYGLNVINKANLSSIVWSEKITIDLTPPILANMTFLDHDQPVLAYSNTTVTAIWQAQDKQSYVEYYQYWFGTTELGQDLIAPTLTLKNNITAHIPAPITSLNQAYLTVAAYNGAFLNTTLSKLVKFTTIPPDNSGAFVSVSNYGRTVTWGGFTDIRTGINLYEIAIGTTAGGREVLDWTVISNGTSTSAILYGPGAMNDSTLVVPTGQSPVWHTIRAYNWANLTTIKTTSSSVFALGSDAAMCPSPSCSDITALGAEGSSLRIISGSGIANGAAIAAFISKESETQQPVRINIAWTWKVARSVHIAATFKAVDSNSASISSWGSSAAVSSEFMVTFAAIGEIRKPVICKKAAGTSAWTCDVTATLSRAQRSIQFAPVTPGIYALYDSVPAPLFYDPGQNGTAAAVGYFTQGSVQRYHTLENATFVQDVALGKKIHVIGDVNQDGVLDYIVGNSITATPADRVYTLAYGGASSLTIAGPSATQCPDRVFIGIADLNGDSKLDTFWTSSTSSIIEERSITVCAMTTTNFNTECRPNAFAITGTPIGLGTWKSLGALTYSCSGSGLCTFQQIHFNVTATNSQLLSNAGTVNAIDTIPNMVDFSIQMLPGQSWSAAVQGDLNGDGYSDLLVQCVSSTSKCDSSSNGTVTTIYLRGGGSTQVLPLINSTLTLGMSVPLV